MRKILDKAIIVFIKIKLQIIRIARIIKVLFPKKDILLYLFLMTLWLIFGYFSKVVNYIHDGKNETFFRTMWNLKNSIFTSIFVSFTIGSLNRLNDYRIKLKAQHNLYVDSMSDFESIFDTLLPDNVWRNYHALYNERCCQFSIEYLKDKNPEIDFAKNQKLTIAIDSIQKRLEKIDDKLKNGMLLVKDEDILSNYISDAQKKILELVLTEDLDEIINLLNVLLQVVDGIRFPWRKDIKLDLRILQLNPDNNDFYKRMWLPDFSITKARNWY